MMSTWQTISVAAALGIDCMGVAAAIATGGPSRSMILGTSALFGAFQSGMTIVGMAGGTALASLVGPRVHLASPMILIFIGLIMIGKGIRSGNTTITIYGIAAILGASVAVSLDALGVGTALGLTGTLSITLIAVIGIVAFLLSLVGFITGMLLARFINFTETAGGILLIVLAVAMVLSM